MISEWHDDKTPIERARHIQLQRLCSERGIVYDEDMTKDQLLQVIRGANVGGGSARPAPREDASILTEMSVFELRAVAKARGIVLDKDDAKETILGKLR